MNAINTRITKEIVTEVNKRRDGGMTIRDLEQFCARARADGFKDNDSPWVNGGLINTLYLRRSEPVDG